MLEVTRKDYIRPAQSRGIGGRAVVTRHMIRNALIPVVTILGPTLAYLVTGSFIIETVFGIPGVGRYYITSISSKDYGVLMAMTILYAFVVAFLNLVVDVMSAYIDPRIRYSFTSATMATQAAISPSPGYMDAGSSVCGDAWS